jgi:hypothetical protein
MGEHGEHAPLELYSVFVTTTEWKNSEKL